MLLTLVPDPLRWSVGDPHADSSKTSLELSFRSGAPSDVPPSGICQHLFSRHREDVRNVPLTGTAASGNRPDLEASSVPAPTPRRLRAQKRACAQREQERRWWTPRARSWFLFQGLPGLV